MKGQQVTRHVQGGVEGHRDAAVQADSRVKHAVEVAEGDTTLRLIVDEEAQRVRSLEVEEDADGRALLNATVCPLRVTAAVHEPRALSVYIHAPALVVLTCGQTIRNIATSKEMSRASCVLARRELCAMQEWMSCKGRIHTALVKVQHLEYLRLAWFCSRLLTRRLLYFVLAMRSAKQGRAGWISRAKGGLFMPRLRCDGLRLRLLLLSFT